VSVGPTGPATVPGPKVFITYRREDTAAHAGRLYDAMVARFGEDNVFMDVDMAPGVDFVERITEAVAACHVLIVVMGPSWATVEDERGTARLSDPEDFVRLEVETALRRTDVTPIPVLVAGARMPNREDLPPELRPITRRNALELGDQRWRYDVERLISALDELLAESPNVPASPEDTSDRATVRASPAPHGPKRPLMESVPESSSQTSGPERWPGWGWGLGLTLLGTLWLPLASLIDPEAKSADTVAAFVGAAVVIVIAAPILMSWRSGAQRNSPMQRSMRVLLSPPLARRYATGVACCLLLAVVTFLAYGLAHAVFDN
jgi:TIR domain